MRRRPPPPHARPRGARSTAPARAGRSLDPAIAVAAVPVPFAVWDRDLALVAANDALLDRFGVPAARRGPGLHLRDLLGPDLFGADLPHLLRALAGEPQRFERTMLDRTGGIRRTVVTHVPDVAPGSGRVRGILTTIVDETDLHAAQAARATAERDAAELLAALPVAVLRCNGCGRVTDANPAAAAMLARDPASLVGRPVAELVHPDDAPALAEALADPGAPAVEVRLHPADHGAPAWAAITVTAVRPAPSGGGGDDHDIGDDAGDGPRLLLTLTDVTARRVEQDAADRERTHDAPTGLPNRRGLLAALDQALARQRRHGGRAALVLLAGATADDDLDDARVARHLADRLRATDLLTRPGPRTFAVLLPECDVPTAAAVADALRDAAAPVAELRSTVVAVRSAATAEQLLQAAEDGLPASPAVEPATVVGT